MENKNYFIIDVIGKQENCPHCNENFNGEDIYEYFLKDHLPEEALRIAECYGWTKENKKCWRKEISIETEQYDGATWYKCPFCHVLWASFPWSDKKYLSSDDYENNLL